MARVLILEPAPGDIVLSEVEALRGLGHEVVVNDYPENSLPPRLSSLAVETVHLNPHSPDDILQNVSARGGYDAIMLRNLTQLDFTTLPALCSPDLSHPLRVIGRSGTGTDNIDIDAARKLGVAVTYTPGVNAHSTAEHAFILMGSAVRQIVKANHDTQRGVWTRSELSQNIAELRDKRVGIVGTGAVAREFAKMAHAFGMQVAMVGSEHFTPAVADSLARELGFPITWAPNIVELGKQCDVVSLHCSLNSRTANLINAQTLQEFKPGSILINTARGGLVDESAVADALRSGQLAAAGIDVFDREGANTFASPLQGAPNAILTPHIAASPPSVLLEVARRITSQVDLALRGRLEDIQPSLATAPRTPSTALLSVHAGGGGETEQIAALLSRMTGMNIAPEAINLANGAALQLAQLLAAKQEILR